MKFPIAQVSLLIFSGLAPGQATNVRGPVIPGPVAVATNGDVSYCFARLRRLDPERQGQAYLVLQLRLTIAYRNPASRPLILPLESKRTVFTALQPGSMKQFKEGLGLFEPSLKVMKHLPDDVSPDNPIDPKNDVFTVIPAGGEMSPPLSEEVTLPVNRKGEIRQYPDLRGRRVYIKLQYEHRDIEPVLMGQLSDRWSQFGVPWTGTLTTNTILVDVPAAPHAEPCKDIYTPAHPKVGEDDKK